MMRNRVGRRRVGGAVAATLAGGLFLALACETPTPPQAGLDSLEEPATGEAMNPSSNPVDGWTLADGGDSVAPTIGEKLLLERIIEARPLVIVDGVIIADASAKGILGDLDPDLIESIEVIKGGAAEALYGERAAEGVIHITTKK